MLLENNREEFMNQHFTFLKILYLGVFNSHFANNDNHNDKLTMSSVNLASQIIKLLNNLLRVINIQYDN